MARASVQDLITNSSNPNTWQFRRASPTHPLNDLGLDTAFVSFGIVAEESALLAARQWQTGTNWSKEIRIYPLKYQYKRGARVLSIVANACGPKGKDITFSSYDRADYLEIKTLTTCDLGTVRKNDDRELPLPTFLYKISQMFRSGPGSLG